MSEANEVKVTKDLDSPSQKTTDVKVDEGKTMDKETTSSAPESSEKPQPEDSKESGKQNETGKQKEAGKPAENLKQDETSKPVESPKPDETRKQEEAGPEKEGDDPKKGPEESKTEDAGTSKEGESPSGEEKDTPKDSPKDAPKDGSSDTPKDAPEDTPKGGSADAPPAASGRDTGGRPRRSGGRDDRNLEKYWVPKTKLGIMVRDGKLTTMDQVLDSGLVLREPEIVDILLGEMQDEVIDVNMVQRMTDSGRRVRFAVTVAVGNENGFLGVGRAHGKEVGPTIRKAIDDAKTNLISLKRGCGSWECGCGAPHSIPFKTKGKSGSVVVTFLPAPKGVGLAVGDVAKKILTLGGVKDLWATTRGQTQTTWNYASAVYEALINLSRMRVNRSQQEKFSILSGGIEE